jgi:hypothetical protein
MAYAFIDEQRVSILAYDVSIADIDERKKKAIQFKTLKMAEQKLGVGQHLLKTALKNRGRVYSTLYEKEYAVRLKPIK